MSLRRALASSTSSWAPTGTFSFDGSTSDLALQLYNRYAAGDVVAQLTLTSVPDTVVSRLSDVGVTFDELDGFAQRAVLWDSGFGVTVDNEAKQIQTIGGVSMSDIALTLDEYETTTCTAFDCTQPDGTSAYNNNQCTGTDILNAVKCVVEEFDQPDKSLAMWSVGGDSSTIPEIEILKHSWSDSSIGENYTVYAVHTLGSSVERNYGACPETETYGYLNIPCYGADMVPSATTVSSPTPSDWVTSWMQEYASGSSSSGSSQSKQNTKSNSGSASSSASASKGAIESNSTNVAVLGGAVGGGLALLLIVVLLGLFVARRRRRRDSEDMGTPKAGDHAELLSPDPARWSDGRRPTVSTHPRSTLDESQPRSGVTVRFSDDSRSNAGTDRGSQQPRHQPSVSHRVRASDARPSHQSNDFRGSGHSTTTRLPDHQENTVRSVPGPVIQPMSYEEDDRSIGPDEASPPQYEEALRTSLKTIPAVAATPASHHEENIRGLEPSNVLQMLAADPNIGRVQLDKLQVEKQLPMTSLQTDSSVARYEGQQVRVKRLASGQKLDLVAFEDLACEIQLRALVGHPNLVQFIGAGWGSGQDLAMVVEFLPLGTLRTHLDKSKASFSNWNAQKTKIAVGIARALAYLHSQAPVYIHHELCTKKVLLTNELEAKLADCGSPEVHPNIGAKQKARLAYWLAPEVLKGAPYSSASDIYSFGVLLTELDTCESPYYDARSPSGSNLEQGEILGLVKEGRLRPSFSADCPRFIRQLGVACCQQDPEKRPTALQVVQILKSS